MSHSVDFPVGFRLDYPLLNPDFMGFSMVFSTPINADFSALGNSVIILVSAGHTAHGGQRSSENKHDFSDPRKPWYNMCVSKTAARKSAPPLRLERATAPHVH